MPTPNYLYVQNILQKEGVRKTVRAVRDRMAREAQAIAAREEPGLVITVSEGTRPQGRPYARISIPAVNEFGDSKTKRLRLLARVVGR